ncbi:MAG: hypothetical protein RJB66_530 [Pseudomonadota bacterium]|jgi:hypothetical protein
MKTYAFLHKTGIALALVGGIFFNSTIWATPSLFGRKSKLLTCEVMLNSDFKNHSVKNSPLPALRDIKYRIQKEIGDRSNDGISFSDLAYSGPLANIDKKKANQIIDRLNGLEEHLTSTKLDQQIISYEIRGDDIKKAMDYLEVKGKELEPLYRKVYNETWSKKTQVVSQALGLFMLTSFIDISYDAIEYFSHLGTETNRSIFFQMIFAANLVADFWKPMLDYNKEKFDLNFYKLKMFLNNNQRSENEIFVSGSSIMVPVEFHQMLMSNDPASVDYARQVATTEIGGSFLDKTFGNFFYLKDRFDERMAREVSNAGNLNRRLYLDHIVYFDKEAGEYVWQFFYRAYQKRPAGKKPQKEQKRETERDFQWVPGLSPVPVPGGA